MDTLPKFPVLQMRIVENIARIRHRISDQFALEGFLQKFRFRVLHEQLCRRTFDLVDFRLCARFDAEPVPIFIAKRICRKTVLCHPFHERLIGAAACLASIDDEIEVTILACIDSAHLSPRHAAAGDAAATSHRWHTVGCPERRRIGESPEEGGLH